jgi:hypothetical protein
MSMIGTKAPEETKDFSLDWSKDIGTDTIATSTWTVSPSSAGISASSIASNATLTTIWIAGGIAGQIYIARNIVVTANGRSMEKTLRLLVSANNYV